MRCPITPILVIAICADFVICAPAVHAQQSSALDADALKTIRAKLKSPVHTEKIRTARALGEMGEKAKGTRADLCLLLIDKHADVRQAGAEAIEQVDRELYQFVIPMLVDGSPSVRIEKIHSLVESENFGEICYPVILAKTKMTVRARSGYPTSELEACLEVVASLGSNDSEATDLILMIAGDRRYGRLSEQCLEKLPKMTASPAKRRVEVLMAALRTSGQETKLIAIRSLGEMGRRSKPAIELLRKEKGSASAEIREAATAALQDIDLDLKKADQERQEKDRKTRTEQESRQCNSASADQSR